MVVVGAVVLVIPNSAHVDVPNVGSGIFFDCGGALYPGGRPAEMPGIRACSDVNGVMLRWGLLLTIGGAATSLAAFWRVRQGQNRPLRDTRNFA
jgi:hypothetical protein